MFNNSYMNTQYTTPPYMGYTQPYMAYQQQMQGRQQMPMQQPQEENQTVPFSEVLYGTLEQAKGRIVLPNRSVLFINSDKKEAYVSWTEANGKPHFETYNYSSMDKLPTENETKPTSQDLFVKKEDLVDFLTKKDLDGVLTRKDLEEINSKLGQLEKKLKISKMIEESDK